MTVNIKKGNYQVFDLTPMIDCVFQLLIFFLVVAHFAEEEREIELALPEASQAVPLTMQPETVAVSIDDQGRYFLGGQEVKFDELRRVLKTAGASNPGRQSVVVRADRRCPWGFVVAVMNVCQEAKIRHYRISAGEGAG